MDQAEKVKSRGNKGYKLLVLADSSNGYTWDFLCTKERCRGTVGRDSVMSQ